MTLHDLFNAARADAQRGDFAVAEKKLKRLLRKKLSSPEKVSTLSLLGAIYGSWGRNDAAVRSLEQAAGLAPHDPNVLVNLCIGLCRVGRLDDAVTVGRRAVAANPSDGDAHYNLAQALKNRGDLGDAADSYKAALKIRNDFAAAHNGLGNVYLEIGDLDRAIASFQSAIEYRQGYAVALNNLGNAYREAGKTAEAIQCFRSSIDADPNSPFSHNHLGHVYRDLRDWDAALSCYRKTLEIAPDFHDARHSIGHIHREIGDYEKAMEAYEAADTMQGRAEVLLCLYALGDYDTFRERERACRDMLGRDIRTAAVCDFVYGQLSADNPHPFCPEPLDFIRKSHLKNHIPETGDFVSDIISRIYDRPAIWEPNAATTQKGFQTRENLFRAAGKPFAGVEAIVRDELNAYREAFASSDSLLIRAWPKNFSLNAHAVRLQKDGHQNAHIHTNGWVSGVIYLKMVDSDNPDEGAILFGPDGYDVPRLKDNVPQHLHRPQVGDIVLFPSSLYHQTIPIRNDGERIIVAFDMMQDDED